MKEFMQDVDYQAKKIPKTRQEIPIAVKISIFAPRDTESNILYK